MSGLPDIGTARHIDEVWHKICDHYTMVKRGAKVKLSRWWSWEQRALQFLDHKGGGAKGLLVVLLYIGWRRKWWSTTRQCPLLDTAAARCVVDDGAGLLPDAEGLGVPEGGAKGVEDEAEVEEDVRRSVAKSKMDVKRARERCANGLAFSCKLRADDRSYRLFKLIAEMPRPLQARTAQEMDMLKTVQEVASAFGSRDFAAALGFRSGGRRTPQQLVDDVYVAAKAFKLLHTLLGSLSLSNMFYTHTPPYFFSGLVSPDPIAVRETLDTCKVMWETLLSLEKAALVDAEINNFLRCLRFPRETFCREMFVLLSEAGFREVPPIAVAQIKGLVSSVGSTLLVENLFNKLRQVERKRMNRSVCARAAWHEQCSSALFEQHGRPRVDISATARASAPNAVPPSTFEPPSHECSLPVNLLDELHSARPQWSSLGFEQYRLVGLRWACCMKFKGCYHQISDAWLSVLQVPGTLTFHTGSRTGWLVVLSTACGFLAWTVALRWVCDTIVVNWDTDERSPLKIECVTNLDEWLCVSVRVRTPGSPSYPAGATQGVLHVTSCGKPEKLLKFAARRGFWSVPITHLRKLFDRLKVEGARPKSECKLVEALVRHVLGDLTDGEAKGYILARDVGPDESDNDDDHAVDELHDLLGSDSDDCDLKKDVAALKEKRDAHRETLIRKAQTVADIFKGKDGRDNLDDGCGAPKPAEKKAIAWVPGRGLLQKEAKVFAPPGSIIIKDTVRHMRWQVRAPWLRPSHSKTFASSEHGSDNSALLYVLSMAWSVYSRQTGTPCPYDIEAVLFEPAGP